jgi:hypothetical protein
MRGYHYILQPLTNLAIDTLEFYFIGIGADDPADNTFYARSFMETLLKGRRERDLHIDNVIVSWDIRSGRARRAHFLDMRKHTGRLFCMSGPPVGEYGPGHATYPGLILRETAPHPYLRGKVHLKNCRGKLEEALVLLAHMQVLNLHIGRRNGLYMDRNVTRAPARMQFSVFKAEW